MNSTTNLERAFRGRSGSCDPSFLPARLPRYLHHRRCRPAGGLPAAEGYSCEERACERHRPRILGIDGHRSRSVRYFPDPSTRARTGSEPWMTTIVDLDTSPASGTQLTTYPLGSRFRKRSDCAAGRLQRSSSRRRRSDFSPREKAVLMVRDDSQEAARAVNPAAGSATRSVAIGLPLGCAFGS